MTFSDDESTVMIELLAAVDFIHAPVRVFDGHRPTMIYELRQRYAESGLRWASGEVTSARRKTAQRTLESLADSGMIDVGRSVGRATTVRFTHHGEASARRLAEDFTGFGQTVEAMGRLAERTGKPGACVDGFVAEWVLAGIEGGDPNWTRKLSDLELELMPAFVHGWVEAQCTCHRNAYYRLTESGDAIVRGETTLPVFADLPEPVLGGADLFIEAFCSARSLVTESTPERASELGFMPRPVSVPLIGEGSN